MKPLWHIFLQKRSVLVVCITAFALVLVFVALNGRLINYNRGDSQRPHLRIHGTELFIDVVSTPEARTRGLSGRLSMAGDTGMLFVFDSPQVIAFWMKDMHFPLDIIWIDEKLRVVDITKNISPGSYPSSFAPKFPVLYVLEANAGFADEHSIVVGDPVEM